MSRYLSRFAPFVLLAACQTAAPVENARADKPAETVLIARDASVKTDTAEAMAHRIEVHDVYSRGTHTRLLVETVARPKAVLVLFAGGKGTMKIRDNGTMRWGNGNFLIRSRPYFLGHGYATAVYDPARDLGELDYDTRSSAAHAADIGAVTRHLRGTFGVPVWLVGTSRGTVSIANAATRLESDLADGLVLTASVFAGSDRVIDLFQFDLGRIREPVLISHHRDDDCWATPARGAEPLKRNLINAKAVEVFLYEGGDPRGNACKARHYHGFPGLEARVIADIAEWIEKHSKP